MTRTIRRFIMLINSNYSRGAFLVLLLFGFVFAQEQKTFKLKSGEKISGEVLSETETSITIKSSIAGEVTIQKSDLKKETITIILNSGDVVKGVVLEKTVDHFKIESAFGEITVPTEQIKSIEEAHKANSQAPLVAKRSLFGTRWETESSQSDEWYFSKERLMDVWFDPTGYTIPKNALYFSGLSWGFGLTDRVQITSKWTNYFWQDFNLRPKITVFKSGNVESQSAFAIGGHLHTRGLPDKYKLIANARKDYNLNSGEEAYTYEDGWVRLGATPNEDGEYYNDWGDGDRFWGELFAAFTLSKLREGGNGRINTTIGASAVLYPGEDLAPRIYLATDIDVSKSVKIMGEIFYDPFFPEMINLENDEPLNTPIHFDVGFLTNKLGLNDNLWVGIHFQRPFIAFYWKF